MQRIRRHTIRNLEALALGVILLIGLIAFGMVAAAQQVIQGLDPTVAVLSALPFPLLVGAGWFGLHALLRWKKAPNEQVLLPTVALLLMLGLAMIYRLRGSEGVWQQLGRGFLPGLVIMGVLIARPRWIEHMRRLAIPLSLVGLALPVITAFFGVVDETGSRLALQLGPLPPIQTSEFIKIGLIIFLAYYIEREGQEVEGRSRPLFGWLRVPALRYFIPGALFVALATLALVQMSDFGAVLILGALFVVMLYAGFETRVFATVAGIGLVMALGVGLILSLTWQVPTVIQYRWIAFQNPWSQDVIVENGQPTGITISEGPGYQIQQAVYALIAGGITGRGLGFGTPEYVPLAHSDFILAGIVEEMGAAVGLAVLFLFAILVLRIFRLAVLLPPAQMFERILLIGIGIHFFIQVFIMAGGTFNLIPLTGVTVPFMSQGGMALLINLAEVGMVLALTQRVKLPIY